MIKVPGGMHEVSSDKTIAGIGANPGITGGGFNIGLPIDNSITSPPPNAVHNVIIQNLTFNRGSVDNVNVQMFSHHVWVHHNTFTSTADGALDIKRGCSFVTVSYNHFIGIHKTALIGHNDGNAAQDVGRLKVTYHHNLFESCQSRQPRVRFGEVHIYNNYYKNMNGYAIGVGAGARAYSENNYKEGGGAFCKYMGAGTSTGGLKDIGSIGGKSLRPEMITWNPKDRYEYKLDPAKDVKSIVTANAGAGKIKFVTSKISPAKMLKQKKRNSVLQLPSGKLTIYNFRGQRITYIKTQNSPGIYLRGYNSNLKPYMYTP
jgi:pectate lyase